MKIGDKIRIVNESHSQCGEEGFLIDTDWSSPPPIQVFLTEAKKFYWVNEFEIELVESIDNSPTDSSPYTIEQRIDCLPTETDSSPSIEQRIDRLEAAVNRLTERLPAEKAIAAKQTTLHVPTPKLKVGQVWEIADYDSSETVYRWVTKDFDDKYYTWDIAGGRPGMPPFESLEELYDSYATEKVEVVAQSLSEFFQKRLQG